MSNNIEITERDIFIFVFSPELLPHGKREYLENNRERFKEEIELCISLRDDSYDARVDEIAKRVESYIGKCQIVELFPSDDRFEKNVYKLRLSAASAKLTQKVNYSSFADSDSNNVIKIIKTGDQTLMYVFSQHSVSKAKVTLLPSETTYIVENISQPIEILDERNIEKINVELY